MLDCFVMAGGLGLGRKKESEKKTTGSEWWSVVRKRDGSFLYLDRMRRALATVRRLPRSVSSLVPSHANPRTGLSCTSTAHGSRSAT